MSGSNFPLHTISYASESASHRLITVRIVCSVLVVSVLALWGAVSASWGFVLLVSFQLSLIAMAVWRIVLVIKSRKPVARPAAPDVWPRYTIMAALYKEAEILPQLVQRLSLIDYPVEALECFLLLEADDHQTQAIARSMRLPPWMRVIVVPEGTPKTKPRALNYGLSMATGQLVTIYDAEDSPDPSQLKEAASRFVADRGKLACLQAPLRIHRRHRAAIPSDILDLQFAAEYAGLFEVVLPGMASMGMPFPLGGTSNHFRVDILRKVGGWDAYNVTEDADLGFRLWRNGYALGTISSPTWETPPGPFKNWLPQRTRWLKGYLQTLAVHLFKAGLGGKGLLAIITTLLAGLLAASIHGYALAAVVMVTALGLMSLELPNIAPVALATLATGYGAAWLISCVGMQRIGMRYGIKEILIAPLYWALLSLAFAHALIRLIFQPHMWDKTPHLPDIPVADMHTPLHQASYLSATAGRKVL